MRKLICSLASDLPLAIAVFLTGCNSMSRMPASTPLSVVNPTPIINRRTNLVPRELKLKLTLDDPADLKVKPGDSVSKGQAIRLKLEHLNTSAEEGSSHVSYAVEQARFVRLRCGCSRRGRRSLSLKPIRLGQIMSGPACRSTRNRCRVTLPRKSGHSRRVDNRGECSDDPKTAQDIYRRAKS
jgi:hypothetical protein